MVTPRSALHAFGKRHLCPVLVAFQRLEKLSLVTIPLKWLKLPSCVHPKKYISHNLNPRWNTFTSVYAQCVESTCVHASSATPLQYGNKNKLKNATCSNTASKIIMETVLFVLTSSERHIWALTPGLCPMFSPPSLSPFIFSLMDLFLESNSTYFLWLDFLLCFLPFFHLLKKKLFGEAVSTCNIQFTSMFY